MKTFRANVHWTREPFNVMVGTQEQVAISEFHFMREFATTVTRRRLEKGQLVGASGTYQADLPSRPVAICTWCDSWIEEDAPAVRIGPRAPIHAEGCLSAATAKGRAPEPSAGS